MKRTTIMLPRELKAKAEKRASDLGISLGELVRESLETKLKASTAEKRREDPLFQDDAVYEGDAPTDLSQSHDEHLYGGKNGA